MRAEFHWHGMGFFLPKVIKSRFFFQSDTMKYKHG